MPVALQLAFLVYVVALTVAIVVAVRHIVVNQWRARGAVNAGTLLLLVILLAQLFANVVSLVSPALHSQSTSTDVSSSSSSSSLSTSPWIDGSEDDSSDSDNGGDYDSELVPATGSGLLRAACGVELVHIVASPLYFVLAAFLASSVGDPAKRNRRSVLIAHSVMYFAATVFLVAGLLFWARDGLCTALEFREVVPGFPSYVNDKLSPTTLAALLGSACIKGVAVCLWRRINFHILSPMMTVIVIGKLTARFIDNAVYSLVGTNLWELLFVVAILFADIRVTSTRPLLCDQHLQTSAKTAASAGDLEEKGQGQFVSIPKASESTPLLREGSE